MVALALVTYIASIVTLAVAATAAILTWRNTDSLAYTVVRRATIGGVFLLLATVALRWANWGMPPMTNSFDGINLFTLLSVAVVAVTQLVAPYHILSSFYLPPLALIALLNALLAPRYFFAMPMHIQGAFLLIHVGLAFLAYALFFVASLTSSAYLVQARQLKQPAMDTAARKLPPLEQLDRLLYRLVAIGYPLFVITLILGVYWAWAGQDRDQLGERWWMSPKILLSIFMAALYSVSFHTRRLGILRGPKLAYLMLCGFNTLLVAYIVLSLLGLRNYNFYGPAS